MVHGSLLVGRARGHGRWRREFVTTHKNGEAVMGKDGETGSTDGRLIVVSNRLPLVLSQASGGAWHLERGSGGLVTAIEPVLKDTQGVWIGWPGLTPEQIRDADEFLDQKSDELGYRVRGVGLSPKQQDDFYLGFANQIIWPLFHDFPTQCNFDPTFWHAYQEVNHRFAEVVADEARDGDFIWIHDYHLMSVAEELHEKGVKSRLGFFLHIPFPSRDLFLKLPWRREVLEALLHYDLIGFQSDRDRTNFVHCLQALRPDVKVEGRGRVLKLEVQGRTLGAGVFPISIDVDEFAGPARSPQVSERVARLWTEFPGRKVILGVDRLDYSKGIPHKLEGYRLALSRYPELQEKVSLVQLVVPSREDIPEYHRMKREIERLVGQISGEFTRPGWVPIHYQYGRWDRPELIAHYRAASVALVTPLKDGMNLVAKEFCSASLEGNGVLILSEHAGATAQLQEDAILVNPYDVEGVAEAIHRACTMPDRERKDRMQRMRRKIQNEDIYWWVDCFRNAANGVEEAEALPLDVYLPSRA
jgi:trehalose 6-phosphate synthase/phosphatase